MTTENVASLYSPDSVAAINAAWEQLLAGQGIDPGQAAFTVVARHDILQALGWTGGDAPTPASAAIICGFYYRELDGDDKYDPGEELTAALLGSPTLLGPGAPVAEVYANCFWFGPLATDKKFTVNFDVEGIASFACELTAQAGLNIVHVPIEPTKPLTYVVTHSHFDPEWRQLYEPYLAEEIPNMISRIELMREQREHVFHLDEECAVRPFLERRPEFRDELRQRVIDGEVEVKATITAGELTMPLGEPMIRQLTEGDQLISKLLGLDIRLDLVWNVDCYGINFQWPQILAKAGRKYAVIGEYNHYLGSRIDPTHIPWSDPEAWNHPEFWLEGIDGSRVLVHRSCYITQPYGPRVPVEQLASHQCAFSFEGWDFAKPTVKMPGKLRDFNDPVKALAYADATDRSDRPILSVPPGASKYILATSRQFFRAIESAPDIPTITTESRIGYWTGAYESRVRGRQLNRRAECLLLATEALSTAANLAGMASAVDDLREAWYLLLINQHHDPQLTTMGPVELFEEVLDRYHQVLTDTQKIADRTLGHLTSNIATDAQSGEPIVVFNSLAWQRSGVVMLPMPSAGGDVRVVDGDGEAVPSQVVNDAEGKPGLALAATDVPAAGWRTYYAQAGEPAAPAAPVTASEDLLENEHIRVELSDGQVTKVIEKSSGKCVFAASEVAMVNEVFIWEDEGCTSQIRPVDFMDSAKLVDRSSRASRTVRLAEAGPVRGVVETSFQMDWGTFVQRVVLDAGATWIDFETAVDWTPAPEGGRRVRAAYPSTFTDAKVWRDSPFAVLPWEQSEAIQPINTWLGLADEAGSLGAALVHDGPCSQQVRGDVLWQTMFRSVRLPGEVGDYDADPPCCWDIAGDKALVEGENSYHFRLHVYAGDWQSAAMPRASLSFNTPMIAQAAAAHAGDLPGEKSHLCVEGSALVQCAWKQADYSAATIARIYNPTDQAVSGKLHVGFAIGEADETNFREEHTGDLAVTDGVISLDFSPYEIKTVRLVSAKE